MKIIVIKNIQVPVEEAYREGLLNSVEAHIKKAWGSSEYIFKGLQSKSLDARRKFSIKYVVSAIVETDDSFSVKGIKNCIEYIPHINEILNRGNTKLMKPPVIAGSGPCGLFCAYLLAQNGFAPIILERGENMDARKKSVMSFWKDGNINTESNVQFGEGGAGTFSDGKLVTRINDRRCGYVLDIFMKNGAPAEVAYEAKPHIGTDALHNIIKAVREKIITLGGRFLYNSRLSDIKTNGNRIYAVSVNNEYEIETEVLVLAIGHSARDTYKMLLERGIDLRQKPFSAGLRIEHLQKDINRIQWGEQGRFIEGQAEYALHTGSGGRTAYTFCMCPGGVVVNASSEEEGLSINGMSYHARKGINANSAWVAEVKPADLGSNHPLAGVEFQRKMERAAFEAGGGGFSAPVQLLKDFTDNRTSTSFKGVKSSFTGETRFADLNEILPSFIRNTLKESLKEFNKKMNYFSYGDAVLTGCETRTSAPVRIIRKDDMQSVSYNGIYPAGEGAGYAGGIMSAAVDGLKVAESIIKLYNYQG